MSSKGTIQFPELKSQPHSPWGCLPRGLL
jgi:hypothetical protein